MRLYYFRRALSDRAGDAGCIVYAVRAAPPEARGDVVPAIGGFPPGWRPTDRPGEALFVAGSTTQLFPCEVPRSQFRHYTRLTEAEARALYPGLVGEGARDIASLSTTHAALPDK